MIYLDHNATTPVLPEVREAMLPFLSEEWGNPSSSYRFGAKLKGTMERAREQVADLIGAKSTREIVFTSGGTESNNTAIHSAIMARPEKRHIVTSQVEHSSVLSYCSYLEQYHGYCVTYLPVDREGLLSLTDLENSITDETAIVSLMWANNETGVLFPVEKIGAFCRNRGVLYHCDAVQAVGKIKVDLASLACDYLTLSAHKIGGPKSVGSLFVYRAAPFVPMLHGGHQERSRRGGTENVASIVGLGAAAAIAREKIPHYETAVRVLRDSFEDGILSSIPGTERNGHKDQRLTNTSNIAFYGVESEAFLILLDQAGLCVSSGSACLAASSEPSHVIEAMKPGVLSKQSIRFSIGLDLAPSDVSRCLSSIIDSRADLLEITL